MEKLGIQLPMLLTQIVNFTIMLLLLTKFLYKPILKALKERKEKISQGLIYAEKMQAEEEKMLKKQGKRLSNLDLSIFSFTSPDIFILSRLVLKKLHISS